jgi:Predicted membrane protein
MNTKYDLKLISIVVMGLFYISVGVNHFIDPYWFLQIVPPYLPYKIELVYISGFLEIVLGVMLLIPKTRVYAGWGLIMLLIAVYPANIYLAQTNGAAMNTTPLIAWGRLPFQFVFIGLAYWHTK